MADESLIDMIRHNMKLLARVTCLWFIYHMKRLYSRLETDK